MVSTMIACIFHYCCDGFPAGFQGFIKHLFGGATFSELGVQRQRDKGPGEVAQFSSCPVTLQPPHDHGAQEWPPGISHSFKKH